MLDVGRLVAAGCARGLDDADAARRTTRRSRTRRTRPGRGRCRTLVPTTPDDPATEANRAAWEVLTALGPAVPVRVQRRRPDHRRDGAGPAQARCPGAAGLDHPVVAGAGHFLQEDAGPRLGEIVAGFVRDALDR